VIVQPIKKKINMKNIKKQGCECEPLCPENNCPPPPLPPDICDDGCVIDVETKCVILSEDADLCGTVVPQGTDLNTFHQQLVSVMCGEKSDVKVAVSGDDEAGGFLDDKLITCGTIKKEIINPGDDEQLKLCLDYSEDCFNGAKEGSDGKLYANNLPLPYDVFFMENSTGTKLYVKFSGHSNNPADYDVQYRNVNVPPDVVNVWHTVVYPGPNPDPSKPKFLDADNNTLRYDLYPTSSSALNYPCDNPIEVRVRSRCDDNVSSWVGGVFRPENFPKITSNNGTVHINTPTGQCGKYDLSLVPAGNPSWDDTWKDIPIGWFLNGAQPSDVCMYKIDFFGKLYFRGGVILGDGAGIITEIPGAKTVHYANFLDIGLIYGSLSSKTKVPSKNVDFYACPTVIPPAASPQYYPNGNDLFGVVVRRQDATFSAEIHFGNQTGNSFQLPEPGLRIGISNMHII